MLFTIDFWRILEKGRGHVAEVSINVGTEGGRLDHSPVTVGSVAGGDQSGVGEVGHQQELERLRVQVQDLERFVFGDSKLGIVGIRQQLQGLRFWNLFNVTLAVVLLGIYVFTRFA